ncbi:MAG TPA: hypothetical protein VGA36_08210 [Nitriliruptorales bacterium]
MAIADLPLADEADVNRLLARGDWVVLAVHVDDEGKALLDALYEQDQYPHYINYRWLRLDAATDKGDAMLTSRGIVPGDRFVILSPYQGAVGLWVLEDLEDREPEDLAQFLDDHAAEIQLEEYEEDFDFDD